MSSLWLMLAMVGTFLFVLLVFVMVDLRQRERNRPVALLQSQVGQVEHSFDERALEGSALSRVVMPGVKKIGRGVQRLTPFDLAERINAKLVLAGSPEGWDAERVVAMKIIGGICGLVGGLLVLALLAVPPPLNTAGIVLSAVTGSTHRASQVHAGAGN